MAHRKLQQEIDRVFKKINEGLEIFDGLYERHSSSLNSSQKDKLEADLKKEIKKLQRFREQIKNWQSTNDVKDKEKLLEYRRLVEVAMEQYKTVEKNSKQKAYSDQSLMSTKPKEMDPEEKERYDTIQFLNTSLNELERQIEALEAELDNFKMSKKGKKGNSYADNERKTQINEFLRIDRFHQEKWEQMLRLLENDVLLSQQVNDIKDGIEYFLEMNQDSEFYEDDTIYDELNMDENDLINEVNVQLKEQKEEEERVLLAASSSTDQNDSVVEDVSKRGSLSNSVSTTPIKHRSVSNPSGNAESSTVLQMSSKSENAPPLPTTTMSSGNSRKVTPLTTSFAAAASTHTPVATSLKPAPFPVKSKPDMTWSAAVGATLNDQHNNGSHNLSSSPSPSNKVRSSSPPTTVNNGTTSRASTTPIESTNQVEIPLIAKVETMKLKQSLSSTINSASLVISDSANSSADAEFETDEDLLLLPPGLQDIITSFVTVRKGPNVKLAKPIDSCATLLRGYRDFSPLPEKIVPNPEEAQKAYNTWMFVKCNGRITELISKVDDATLFFIYYYSILLLEKKLAEKALFAKGWKLHKSKIYWLQRLGEPLIFPTYEQGHYRVFDASKWSVQEHPGFQLVYADFSPDQSPFKNGSIV